MISRNTLIYSLTLIALTALPVTPTSAQEMEDHESGAVTERKTGAPDPADQAAMMEKMVAAMTPGEMHKKLDALVGSWDTTTKVWCMGPGADPLVSQGSATKEWVLNGHFIMEHTKGTMQMPGPDGQMQEHQFEGMGVTGYDNVKKQFNFGWCDNMSTQTIEGLGNYDEAERTWTYYGTMDDVMTGTMDKPTKYVTRVVDEDTHVFEIHDLSMGAKGTQMLEVTYKRVTDADKAADDSDSMRDAADAADDAAEHAAEDADEARDRAEDARDAAEDDQPTIKIDVDR